MGDGLPDINRRAQKILQAVISQYLQTGEAVGSRTVTRRHGIGLSPATVRNVMADLEELGLLAQPHTSAGRVPTSTGLRFFIDSLLKVRGLPPKEKARIREMFGEDALDPNGVVQRTSRILSEITHHAALVLAPDLGQQRFRHIEFVRLRGDKYLCILVTTDGRIENRLLEIPEDIAANRIERINGYLEQLLGGLTLDEMRQRVIAELGKEKNQYDALVSAALRLSRAALEQPDPEVEIVVSGQANLIDPSRGGDGEQLDRMRGLLEKLEDKEALVRLLDRSLHAAGIQVFLGSETAESALDDSSLIATPYGPGDRPLGVIAVIGPTRMNYATVMSVVDFTADLVSAMMRGDEG
jgi:heat-inducible transcriptional repressor